MTQEALKQMNLALETMEAAGKRIDELKAENKALKEALAQLEQSNRCGEPDWKSLVLSHNEDCESRCDMDRCGYKPYYEYSKRRCPDCPVHEKIWVDDTTPPQRTFVGLTGKILISAAQSSLPPDQYEHFVAISEYEPEIYDRLAKAIQFHLKENT